MSRLLSSVLLSAGIALSAAPLLAQDATAPAAKERAAQKSQRQRKPPERADREPLTELKSTLKITSGQSSSGTLSPTRCASRRAPATIASRKGCRAIKAPSPRDDRDPAAEQRQNSWPMRPSG